MMSKPARLLLHTALALTASLTLAAGPAAAQAYPSRPVTMVVPNGAGGSNDVVARIIAEKMSALMGQSFVVENRPGAGGNIGTASVARGDRDGYTLLMTVNSSQAINPLLYKEVNFDPVKDFVSIGMVGTVANVLLISSRLPVRTLDELVEQAKTQPNRFRYGSAGNGTLPHLLGAMLANRYEIELEHVPYRGISQAMTDVLGGQISMAFATVPVALPQIESGAVRALGVSSTQRIDALPEVPAIAEKLPGYEGVLWIALFAPAGTPEPVAQALSKALGQARTSPDVGKKLADMGVTVLDEGPDQLAARLRAEMERWQPIIARAGAKVD